MKTPSPRIKNVESEMLSDYWGVLKKWRYDCFENNTWTHQERECYDRGNGVAALLYHPQRHTVILIRQLRLPTYLNGNPDGILIEVPAGVIDANEAPIDAVQREVYEETHIHPQNPTFLFEAYMSPGSVTEKIYFFACQYDTPPINHHNIYNPHEHEDIQVIELHINTAIEYIQNGKIQDAKTMMLLWYAQTTIWGMNASKTL